MSIRNKPPKSISAARSKAAIGKDSERGKDGKKEEKLQNRGVDCVLYVLCG
jgi:hypothetical protein